PPDHTNGPNACAVDPAGPLMVSEPLERVRVPFTFRLMLSINRVPPPMVRPLSVGMAAVVLSMVSVPPLMVSVPPVAVIRVMDWLPAGSAAFSSTLLPPRHTVSEGPGSTPVPTLVLQFAAVPQRPPDAPVNVIVQVPGATPVPVSETICGLPAASSAKLSDALSMVVVEGLNVSVTVQVPPFAATG